MTPRYLSLAAMQYACENPECAVWAVDEEAFFKFHVGARADFASWKFDNGT